MPRGSNNRVDEQNTNRNNNNRMFDSQNNNKGGYSVGVDVDDYEDGVRVQTPCPAIFLRRRRIMRRAARGSANAALRRARGRKCLREGRCATRTRPRALR